MLMAPVIGHRGCAGHAPENTLVGIRDSARVGCTWIEADATLLEDGNVVLFHDDTLDRCTNATGFIRKTHWDNLLKLDCGGWYGDGRFVGERVPLLKDAITCCQALGLGFNIELKIHRGEGLELAAAVSQIVDETAHGDMLVSSFDHQALGAVTSSLPKGALFDRLVEGWQEVSCQSVHLWGKHISKSDVEMVKQTGREVYVFTINDWEEAQRLYDMGVDGVFSDFPDRLSRSSSNNKTI